jgi:hypothetical protein
MTFFLIGSKYNGATGESDGDSVHDLPRPIAGILGLLGRSMGPATSVHHNHAHLLCLMYRSSNDSNLWGLTLPSHGASIWI